MTRIVIGSRGSDLALTQTNYIADRLRAISPHIDVVVEIISTKGDRVTDVPLAQVGGKGLFTKELEVALLDGSIDLAVHSLKDLPTVLPGGLALGAVPEREDPTDALVSVSGACLMDLPQGATVGTSSTRRQVQLKACRPDLKLVDIRGNVPTRLKKLRDEGMDAIVLASAGLSRLGLSEHVTEHIRAEHMLSAVGQGALGIEIREGDPILIPLLAQIHDAETAAATTAERTLLDALGGGCQVPLGALATITAGVITLQACACSPDGSQVIRATEKGPIDDPAGLGRAMAAILMKRGASTFIQQSNLESLKPKQPLVGKTIVVTRAANQASALSSELTDLGATVVDFPTIAVNPTIPDVMIEGEGYYDWLIFTSANGVNHFVTALETQGRKLAEFRAAAICAIGPATAAALQACRAPVTLTPQHYVAESILDGLKTLENSLEGKRFLMPRGNLARPALPDALRAAGAEVTECIVYETVMPEIAPAQINAMLTSTPDLITFTSSSTARNFVAALTEAQLAALKGATRFASIGPITTATATELGLEIIIEPDRHEITALIHAILDAPEFRLDSSPGRS